MKVLLRSSAAAKRGCALRYFSLPCLAGLLLSATKLQAAVPPDPTVELRFPEGPSGTGANVTNLNPVITTNTGTLEGNLFFAMDATNPWETNTFPVFTNLVPTGTYVPAGNNFSVDMGTLSGASAAGNGGRAIDSTNTVADLPSMGAYPKLTICGWANANSLPGVRSVSLAFAFETATASGFDLSENLDGTIGLFINDDDNDPTYSTVRLTASSSYANNNWVFFAVTYDPTLASQHLKYYFGRPDKLAALDVAADYVPSLIGPNVDYTGALTVGNVGTIATPPRNDTGGVSHQFKGLLDEIKIYTNALTLDEVQQAQVNAVVAPTPATFLKQPVSAAAPEGGNAVFNCEASGSGQVTYQWRTNGVAVTGATNTSFTMSNVQMADNGTLVSVVISNAPITPPGLASADVTLTVFSADPKIAAFSFFNPSSILIPNAGSFAGSGRMRITGGFPLIIATNVPTGLFAPNPAFNRDSLHMGTTAAHRAVDMTNNLVSSVGSLGNMNGLTICGWLNSANRTYRSTSTGRGCGVVNASLGGANGGFALAYRDNTLSGNTGGYGNNGRLALYVNDWTGDPAAAQLSSLDTIPLNTNLPPENWIYFAVTYDGTLTENNLNFYFGSPTNAAALDPVSPQTYNKGVIAATGPLAIGNHNSTPGNPDAAMPGNPSGRTTGGDNGTMWRGLMDEIKIYNKVLTLAEIQAAQIAPSLPPLLLQETVTNNTVLSWEGVWQLQSRTNLALGSWNDVSTPTNVSGNIRSLAIPPSLDAEFFRLRGQ